MNTDTTTTLTGVLTGIAAILATFNIVIPQWASGLIVAVGVAVLGYFTNKVKK
jgi:hypothetical protein